MNRQSFILHTDTLAVLDELSDRQAGQLFKAIRDFQQGKEPELDITLKIAFLPFKNQFIRDDVKYAKVVEKNSANGAKGGRPKKTDETPTDQVIGAGVQSTDLSAPPDEQPQEQLPGAGKKADSDGVDVHVSGSEKNSAEGDKKTAATSAPHLMDFKQLNQGLHGDCMELYSNWFEKFAGNGVKIDGVQGKALHALIEYIGGEVVKKTGAETPLGEHDYRQKVKEGFEYIFNHWRRLEPFLQQKTKLTEINSNIQNILVQIKNPGKQSGYKLNLEKPPWRR